MKAIQIIKNNIPNIITCCNLLSGALACIFSFKTQQSFGGLQGYEMAFLFIGLAALFDFCDGFAARLLHANSPLGKELDSLADLISFGLAPALLIFNTMEVYNGGSLWSYGVLIIAAFAGVRLAKFNIDDRQTTTFIGLPVPANALFWIGFCAWMHTYTYVGNIAVLIIAVIFSWLMISNISMFSLKFKNLRITENFKRYILILGAILFLAYYQVSGFAWTIILYIAMSVFGKKNEIAE